MFTNIAGKLKGLAVVQTIIFVVFGIIILTLPYQKCGFVPESDLYFLQVDQTHTEAIGQSTPPI